MGKVGTTPPAAGKTVPHTPASVTEHTVSLKTWLPQPAESLPSLLNHGWPRNIYPYARRESHTVGQPVPKTYRVVRLANEYLEVDVLPELGGHVWGAKDKKNNAEVFHRVDAIKLQDLGVAGAWLATGIEFNFPVTHSILTVEPIVETHGVDPDGSAWVCIGASDKLFGLRWQMHLRLSPGVRKLQIYGWLHNPTEQEHPWCYWGNAGVTTHPSLRLYYPFTWAEHHGGLQFQWPLERGKDLSYWRDCPEPVSIFGQTGEARWFGAYYDDFGRGVVHTSDPRTVPGKKYFAWGTGEAGKRWADLLSDNHTGYVEIQSGSRNDQEFWNVLKPHSTFRIAECWQPIDALGGITAADESLTVYLDRKRDSEEVTLRAQPAEPLRGVEFTAYLGEKVLERWNANLTPDQIHTYALKAAFDEKQPLRVEAQPADRASVLVAHERLPLPERPASREEKTDFGEISAQAYRHVALEAAQNMNWSLARTYFEAALKLAPNDPSTLREVGLFRLRRFEYASAVRALSKALKLGGESEQIADRALRWGLWWAKYNAAKKRSPRALAVLAAELLKHEEDLHAYAASLLALGSGRPQDVLIEYAGRPLNQLIGNRDLAAMKLVAARKSGEADAKLLTEMRRSFPTDPLIAAEAGTDVLAKLLEIDPDMGVTAACEYAKLFDYAKARSALEQAAQAGGWSLSRRVLAAYLAHLDGAKKESVDLLEEFAAFDGVTDRPWQELFYRAVPWALEHRPGDARLHFIWGNLLAHAGRQEEALEAWKKSAELGGEWPQLHFLVAMLQSELGGASDEQLARMQKIAAAENKWEYAAPYLDALRLSGRRRERYAELQRLASLPDHHERIPVLCAVEACVVEDVDTALAYLLNNKFPPAHGGGLLSYSHVRLRRLRAERAIAAGDLALARKELEAAEKIQHHFQEDVQQLHCLAALNITRAKLEELSGNKEAARKAYEASVAEEHDLRSPLRLYSALALIKLGHVDEGEKTIARIEALAKARLKQPHPWHASYLHLLAIVAEFRGNKKEHDRLMKKAIDKGVLFINWGWGF
ncbi:MAG: DUF5107 domain-containing protein [Planctomycetes bacterium]|nr:DUF5107 domain-containing protein [Planctomycetota bacterium]